MTGADILPRAANESMLEQYFSVDLDQGIGPVIEGLHGKRFDRVLLLDVLEHLHRPEVILQQCHETLRPEGRLIVSVPNIANITIRLMLLLGKFDYTERGILDKTHLRFFTRKTARRLLQENGYQVQEEKEALMPIELVFGLSAQNILMRIGNRVLAFCTWLLPGLFGYQIMFVAKSHQGSSYTGVK